MVHPLFRLVTARPQLLAEHVSAYTDLLAEELSSTAGLLKRRVMLQLVALAAAATGVVLGGVAVMLWAVLPTGSLPQPWLLLLVPALPLVLAAWAAATGGALPRGDLLVTFRRQLAADTAMLRQAGEP